jgi:hypothetical protein
MCIYCNRPCQVPTLRWLADNGCPLDQSQSLMCQSAAAAGHLATLQWLVKAGCRWSKLSCLYAAGERVFVLNSCSISSTCVWICYQLGCSESLLIE